MTQCLIRGAEIDGRDHMSVRCVDGFVAEIGRLEPRPSEFVINADGGLLIPGLHDHHLHLYSLAASLQSVRCGPPEVHDEPALIEALSQPGDGWLRGVGYHESVAGEIDRAWLDRHVPTRPVRVQHRSGRLWILNGRALQAMGIDDVPDGRLYDQDVMLRRLRQPPDIARASAVLARYGVTGVTDMTPSNDEPDHYAVLTARGALTQSCTVAGCCVAGIPIRKFHLHDVELPPLDELIRDIRQAHSAGQTIAVHCVTEVGLVFTLAAIREAGALPGDRIEHASVCPQALVEQIAELGVTVVTQPNFVAERGDAYASDLPRDELDDLYRLKSFDDAGVPLAAGTDAPFGDPNPWAAMAAATRRTTPDGRVLGANEIVTPERALALFLGEPHAPHKPRQLTVGMPADLCVLDRPWSQAKSALAEVTVQHTLFAGTLWADEDG